MSKTHLIIGKEGGRDPVILFVHKWGLYLSIRTLCAPGYDRFDGWRYRFVKRVYRMRLCLGREYGWFKLKFLVRRVNG